MAMILVQMCCSSSRFTVMLYMPKVIQQGSGGNNIGSDDAVALAVALQCCTSLEHLDLDGNDIGSDGAVALAGLL